VTPQPGGGFKKSGGGGRSRSLRRIQGGTLTPPLPLVLPPPSHPRFCLRMFGSQTRDASCELRWSKVNPESWQAAVLVAAELVAKVSGEQKSVGPSLLNSEQPFGISPIPCRWGGRGGAGWVSFGPIFFPRSPSDRLPRGLTARPGFRDPGGFRPPPPGWRGGGVSVE